MREFTRFCTSVNFFIPPRTGQFIDVTGDDEHPLLRAPAVKDRSIPDEPTHQDFTESCFDDVTGDDLLKTGKYSAVSRFSAW